MKVLNSNAIIRLASIILFFFIWQMSSNLVNVDLLPSPKNVLIKLNEEALNNELFFHTLITLKRVFLSFLIAMFIGTFFGIYMGRNSKANTFLDDWLVFFKNKDVFYDPGLTTANKRPYNQWRSKKKFMETLVEDIYIPTNK